MGIRAPSLIFTFAMAVTMAACSSPAATSQNTRVEPPARPTIAMHGRASWYGKQHHGRITASGETFDMHGLTAAHPTLPLGTRLRVTNVANDRAVIVRVNDRSPYGRDRILDLSYGAARALHAVGAGVIKVRLAVVN